MRFLRAGLQLHVVVSVSCRHPSLALAVRAILGQPKGVEYGTPIPFLLVCVIVIDEMRELVRQRLKYLQPGERTEGKFFLTFDSDLFDVMCGDVD